MSTFIIVVIQPVVQILLQLPDRLIDLFPQSRPVKLIQNSTVESFTNTTGLWMPRLGAGTFNIVQCQIERVVMLIRPTTIPGSPISQDT